LETRYLKTLVVAVEAGSFSRAAEILNLTQSAVSQRVKFLEERYGHQLLDRSGPRLRPTEVGHLVLAKSRALLEKEHELLEELRRFDGQKRLSLCCTPTFGTAYLPWVLNRFVLQYSDVSDLKFIFHQPGEALRRLAAGEYDLAVIEHCDGVDFSSFVIHELPRDELVFIAAPDLGLGSEARLSELQRHRLLARKDGCSSRQLLEENLAGCGANLDGFAGLTVSDNLAWTIENVRQGAGIAFLSKSLVEKDLAEGGLLACRVQGFVHQRNRSVASVHGRAPGQTVRQFLECLFEVFALAGTGPESGAGCWRAAGGG